MARATSMTHDTPEGFSGQDYFPEKIGRQNFYRPVERGFERDIIKRLDYWSKLRTKEGRREGVGVPRFSAAPGIGLS